MSIRAANFHAAGGGPGLVNDRNYDATIDRTAHVYSVEHVCLPDTSGVCAGLGENDRAFVVRIVQALCYVTRAGAGIERLERLDVGNDQTVTVAAVLAPAHMAAVDFQHLSDVWAIVGPCAARHLWVEAFSPSKGTRRLRIGLSADRVRLHRPFTLTTDHVLVFERERTARAALSHDPDAEAEAEAEAAAVDGPGTAVPAHVLAQFPPAEHAFVRTLSA